MSRNNVFPLHAERIPNSRPGPDALRLVPRYMETSSDGSLPKRVPNAAPPVPVTETTTRYWEAPEADKERAKRRAEMFSIYLLAVAKGRQAALSEKGGEFSRGHHRKM